MARYRAGTVWARAGWGGLLEWIGFGLKQSRACLFAGGFFLLLFVSQHIPLGGLARYDFLFLATLGLQGLLIATRLETWQEMRVIFLFHLVGFGLELFKTHPDIASWSYPEPAFFKIATVPLYSGFMYSAVGSYLNMAWKLFRLEFTHFPHGGWLVGLGVAIYLNFFTHHVMVDLRWWLIAAVFALFARTWVSFTVFETSRRMPLGMSFVLIGFFIWVAENIATYGGAWAYPDQLAEWTVVSPQKISSWFLLVIVSFNLVALLHRRALWTKDRVHPVEIDAIGPRGGENRPGPYRGSAENSRKQG